MNHSNNSRKVGKVEAELILLRGDYKQVRTPSVKKIILNQIAQMENSVRTTTAKNLAHIVAIGQREAPFLPPTKQRCALGFKKMKEIEISSRR